MFRRSSRSVLAVPVLVGATLPFAVAPPAAAANILVGCTELGLVLAFELASDENHPGPDTIVLSSGCTYSLDEEYGDTGNALPRVPTGSGITVQGHGAIIERAEDAPAFGVTSVSGDLLIDDVTFREFWGFTGAYFHVGGSLQLVDSTITNVPPTGQQDPAILNETSGTVLLQDTVIENQFDVDGGGGAAVQNKGFLATYGATFRNDHFAFLGDPGNGGALSNTGTAYLYDTTFAGNDSTATGGAIRNSGYLEIDDSTFTDNGSGTNFGGAIANSSDLIVTDSFFGDNDADIAGGAIYNDGTGISQVDDSTFYSNAAGSRGGAIENRHAVNVEQVTFSGNTAGTGASIDSELGGVAAEASIFAGSGSHCAGTVFDFGDNLVHPSLGACPASFTVADPKLTGPAMRGGPTQSIALGAGSAAFDAAGSSCAATDQRGFPRPRGAACDAGALEDQPPTAPAAPALTGGSVSPNRGTFGLTWTGGTDPDGTPLSWTLTEQRSDQHVLNQVATPATNSQQFFNHGEGVWRFRVTASDGNLTSASSPTSTAVMVDASAPTAPVPSTDRAAEYAADGGWWADTVTVTFAGSTDPVLVDGSPGSGVASYSPAATFTTSGPHTASGTATDAAGNVSGSASLTVQVDATPPVVGFASCPGQAVLGTATSVGWSAGDAHSGLATAAGGTIALDTSSIATRTVTASATDNVGHTSTATCTFDVVYPFAGFYKPLLNPPSTVTVRAGDTVQLSWSLGGFQGLGVIEPGFPVSAPITCGTSPALTTGTPTTSRRGLQYLASPSGRYAYGWSTQTSWAGTCRQVVVLLDDGTYHRANLRFS